MPCSSISELQRLADALVTGASLELYLTPKPGLVDCADNGSHPDLTRATMERSIALVGDALGQIVGSLACGAPFAAQRRIAAAAEERLLASLATNTHKGYLFLSSLLLIARWHAAAASEQALRERLSALADEFFRSATPTTSKGASARQTYGVSGIVREAQDAYPSVFEHALPAFRDCLRARACLEAASFAMLARLMQCVEDTTTLHRAGAPGLARIKADGRRLEALIGAGDEARSWLAETNRAYIRLGLTMGGVADLLAIAYGCLIAGGEIPPGARLGGQAADWKGLIRGLRATDSTRTTSFAKFTI